MLKATGILVGYYKLAILSGGELSMLSSVLQTETRNELPGQVYIG